MKPQAQVVKFPDQAKQEILDAAGDLSNLEVMYNQILVGIWKRPEKTPGGIFLTETTRKEDDYQGKVCLILKMGRSAFEDTADMQFPVKAKVGDWIVLRPGDGWQLKVKDQACRMLVDTSVKMIINEPYLVY